MLASSGLAGLEMMAADFMRRASLHHGSTEDTEFLSFFEGSCNQGKPPEKKIPCFPCFRGAVASRFSSVARRSAKNGVQQKFTIAFGAGDRGFDGRDVRAAQVCDRRGNFGQDKELHA